MSGIVITIEEGDTSENFRATADGTLINIVADSERAIFGIGSDNDLKTAVEQYLHKRPTYAFLRSPSSQSDLYKAGGWSEVQMVLIPKKAVVSSMTTKPIIVVSKTLKNTSSQEATFSTKISGTVSNTLSNQRSSNHAGNVGQSFNYKMDFKVLGASGATNFGFTSSYGKSTTVTSQTTLAMGSAVSVVLKPKEQKIVQLSASMVKMSVQITYEAHLKGHTVITDQSKLKDYRSFLNLPIETVLGASNKAEITEDIEVDFHSRETIEVKD